MLASLPPNPKIHVDSELLSLLNQAEYSLLKLNGALLLFDSSDPLLNLLSISEAIENINVDNPKFGLLDYFSNSLSDNINKNTRIENVRSAGLLGQKLLKDVSHTSHILKSIHKEIFKENTDNNYGKFRSTNLGVGENNDIQSIKYLAPEPNEIEILIHELEKYISSNISYPVLVNAALIHAQFEMIHPFHIGNGLVGRILIHLNLVWKKILSGQFLQISRILRSKRLEYFDRLEDIEKNNNWISWIKFFVRSINDGSNLTLKILIEASQLKRKLYEQHFSETLNSISAIQAFDYIFRNPVLSSTSITNELSINKQTASVIINKFIEHSILEEITGQQRNRVFINRQLLNICSQ
jgi:Fic family protein